MYNVCTNTWFSNFYTVLQFSLFQYKIIHFFSPRNLTLNVIYTSGLMFLLEFLLLRVLFPGRFGYLLLFSLLLYQIAVTNTVSCKSTALIKSYCQIIDFPGHQIPRFSHKLDFLKNWIFVGNFKLLCICT